MAESRLRDDAERAEVELVPDAVDGPYAGVHRMAAVEFLARRVDHIPAPGEVRTRAYGAYASRRRAWWRRRWAEWLRLVFEVDVTVCPRCGGAMRILAFVTGPTSGGCPAVVTRIVAHLERRGLDARAGPWAGAAAG